MAKSHCIEKLISRDIKALLSMTVRSTTTSWDHDNCHYQHNTNTATTLWIIGFSHRWGTIVFRFSYSLLNSTELSLAQVSAEVFFPAFNGRIFLMDDITNHLIQSYKPKKFNSEKSKQLYLLLSEFVFPPNDSKHLKDSYYYLHCRHNNKSVHFVE